MGTRAGAILTFNTYNGYTIDESNAMLVNEAGTGIKLRKKTFLVLLTLARSDTRLVSKEDIIRQVWPESVVTSDSLVQCIREIRTALGVSTKEVLLTRARLGYELHPDPVPTAQLPSAKPNRVADPSSVVSKSTDGQSYRSSVMVGRQAELNKVVEWLIQHDPDRQGLMVITGDAGVGKSCLLNALRESGGDVDSWEMCTSLCFEFGSDLAYSTLANWLRTPQITKYVAQLNADRRQVISLVLPELADADVVHHADADGLQSHNRLQLYEAVLAVFQFSVKPVVFVIDNLQWCDKESLAWLEYLQCRKNTPAHAILCASRPCVDSAHCAGIKFLDYFKSNDQFEELNLMPLSRDSSEQLLRHLLPSDNGFEHIDEAISVSKGHPLHLCEIARCARSYSDQPVSLDQGIRHFLALRMSQLNADQRYLLDVCAVLGTCFSVNILSHILGESEESVFASLDQLWSLAFLDVVEAGEFGIHDLVRGCIYDSLSPVNRSRIHIKVATYFAGEVSQGKKECYAPLARHYQSAGVFDKAATCFQLAAAHFRHRLATLAEAGELEHAIFCLERLPASAEVNKTRVELLLDLGLAWSRDTGWGAKRIGKVWGEAYSLAKSIDDVALRARATNTYDTYLRDNGQWHQCVVIGREVNDMKSELVDPYLRQSIASSRAALLLHTGKLQQCLKSYNEILRTTENATTEASYNWFNSGHRIGAFFRSAQCLWLMGKKAEGKERCDQAIKLSMAGTQPFHQAITLFHVCLFYEFDQNYERVLEYAQQLLHLSRKYNFLYYAGAARLYISFANLNMSGNPAEVDKIHKITNQQHENGTRMFDTYWFSNLAMARMLTGDVAAAHTIANRTLERSRFTTNCFWDSELHRICGDTRRLLGHCKEPDDNWHYRRSVEIAHRQGAKELLDRAQSQSLKSFTLPERLAGSITTCFSVIEGFGGTTGAGCD